MELSMTSYKMVKHHNSSIASSALYLALKMTKQPNPWSETMVKHS